jgi:hypothetical protein
MLGALLVLGGAGMALVSPIGLFVGSAALAAGVRVIQKAAAIRA